MIISRKKIAEFIDDANRDYLQCWHTLCKIKRGASSATSIVDELLAFQPTLASAIFKLEKLYRQLHQEKLNLIGKKKSLNDAWFRSRMKLIKGYQEGVKETISIGKTLGDAFAWIFYRNERESLLSHWKCNRNFHSFFSKQIWLNQRKEITKAFDLNKSITIKLFTHLYAPIILIDIFSATLTKADTDIDPMSTALIHLNIYQEFK